MFQIIEEENIRTFQIAIEIRCDATWDDNRALKKRITKEQRWSISGESVDKKPNDIDTSPFVHEVEFQIDNYFLFFSLEN